MSARTLDRPALGDLDDVFEIYSDPRVWSHFPSGRITTREGAEAFLLSRIAGWETDGLGTWIVRDSPEGPMLGNCGCSIRKDAFWNLGYRFRPEVQGRGLATDISRLAISRAQQVRPELPVIAYLLEHNVSSRRVAEKLGLSLRHRAPDAGNPDPSAMRLVFSDRALTPTQLDAALG